MKAVLVLAAVVLAAPGVAQTQASPHNAVNMGVPTCVANGTCPSLRGTIIRQLGLAPQATPPVGGPFEPAAAAAPRARAVADYPPCRSRSDDRCIQRGTRR